MMTLQPLNLSDRGEVLQLVEFINAHYRSAVPLSEASVSSGRTNFFWAVVEGSRVGASAYVERTPTLAETVKTVIDPAYRGKRYGEMLSQAIEDQVRRDGFKKVMTTVYIDNLPMIMIKLRQGYRFEGFHPDHEKPGWHEYSFGKVLS
jgi:RimJ/RimL family protein N-acetyltransferase